MTTRGELFPVTEVREHARIEACGRAWWIPVRARWRWRSPRGEGEVVLFFPGGHATAATPLCTDLYTGQGYRALVFLAPRPPGHNGHRQERITAGR